jgi:hypothetical protein
MGKHKITHKNLKNVRGSLSSILLTFSQSYVEHDLRKNKIVVAFTIDFFKH